MKQGSSLHLSRLQYQYLLTQQWRKNGYVKKAYLESNIESSQSHVGDRCILRKTGDTIIASIPESIGYAVAHQNVYVVKDKLGLSMKFWMALLNSKMFTFLYQNGLWGQKGRTMAQFRIYALAALPIPQPFDKQFVDKVTKCIDKILLKQEITEKESEIDRLVYQLYGLTDEEIRIVEGKE